MTPPIPQRGAVLSVEASGAYGVWLAGPADVTSADATGVEVHHRRAHVTRWYDWHPSDRGDVVLAMRSREGVRLRATVVPTTEGGGQ